MTDLAQSAQDQDQQDPTVAAQPPAPAAPTPAPGPWSQDLEAAFPDPVQRAAVDNFLRARIQPHTTQLEQQLAAAREGAQFLQEFRTNPLDQYVSVTAELFGEDQGQKVLEFIQQQLEEGTPPEEVEQTVQQALTADPRTEAALSWVEQQQAEKAYNEELSRIQAAHPEVVPEDFHAFVAATEGDFDRAYMLYSSFVQKYGQPVQVSADEPTPVLGSDTATAQASSTPTEPKHQTINDAIDGMMNDIRASKEAPPVGVA